MSHGAGDSGGSVDVTGIDHAVVYADDVDSTSAFYADVLGAERFEYGPGWWSVRFDGGQLNFRPADKEYDLVASAPTAGAADVCLETPGPLDAVVEALEARDVAIVEGPVEREGSRGDMTSVYVHDPEGNLVEFAVYP